MTVEIEGITYVIFPYSEFNNLMKHIPTSSSAVFFEGDLIYVRKKFFFECVESKMRSLREKEYVRNRFDKIEGVKKLLELAK